MQNMKIGENFGLTFLDRSKNRAIQKFDLKICKKANMMLGFHKVITNFQAFYIQNKYPP